MLSYICCKSVNYDAQFNYCKVVLNVLLVGLLRQQAYFTCQWKQPRTLLWDWAAQAQQDSEITSTTLHHYSTSAHQNVYVY